MSAIERLALPERVRRAETIIASRAQGDTWDQIAAAHSVSVRTAQRIVNDGTASRQSVLARDPLELAGEVLQDYEDAIADLRRLASETRHDGTRLGAIRGRVEVLNMRFQLMAALGMFPSDLKHLAAVVDGRRTADAVMDVLERHGASDEMWEAMEAAFGIGAGS